MDSTDRSFAPRRSVLPCVYCLTSIVLIGCGEAPPFDLAAVRGAISIDGKPLVGGKVMFAPVATGGSPNAGKPAFGRIQPDGSYTLTTYKDNDGGIVGENWVTIFIPDKSDPPASAVDPTADLKYKRLPITQKQVIEAGKENQIDIHLNSQEVARRAR